MSARRGLTRYASMECTGPRRGRLRETGRPAGYGCAATLAPWRRWSIWMPTPTPAPVDPARADTVATGGSATPPPTAEVLGVRLALTDYERTMDWIDAS